MASFENRVLRQDLSRLAHIVAFKSTDMVLQVPVLRDLVLARVLHRLARTYDEKMIDQAALAHQRWFASHLVSFLERLIKERPNAARAILRFIDTWIQDMCRRTDAANAGLCTPCTVVIDPTERCNLACPGCYANSVRTGSDLPFDRIVEIVEAVISMGVTLVTISGGEPFLREKDDRVITRLAERFSNHGFLVYTNGTLIDEQTARRLGKLGNVFPAISVEGFEHQTDARRGEGIYDQNRRARGMLADENVMTGFSATVTSKNVASICTDEFIELRIAEGDLFGWFFILQPIGRHPRTDLMVDAEQRALLRETIYRWREENRPIFLGDFWNDGHLVGGCIAGGRYYFHIYGNGDISPCVFAPVTCGNIFDIINAKTPYKDLNDFVQNHSMFRAFREEQEKITDRDRPCLLIDNPEAFRRCCARAEYRPAKNMPEGYTDGEIARAIDRAAAEWREYCATKLAPLPADRTRYALAESRVSSF